MTRLSCGAKVRGRPRGRPHAWQPARSDELQRPRRRRLSEAGEVEAEEAGGVAAHDRGGLIRRQTAEELLKVLSGVGEGPFRVGQVGAPEEVADAEEIAPFD